VLVEKLSARHPTFFHSSDSLAGFFVVIEDKRYCTRHDDGRGSGSRAPGDDDEDGEREEADPRN
jgi:hypothetical protein